MVKTKTITLEVTRISVGKDDRLYVTVHHPKSNNWPTLVFNKSYFKEIDKEIKKYEQKT